MFRHGSHGSPPPHLACSQMLWSHRIISVWSSAPPNQREPQDQNSLSLRGDGRVKNAQTKQNISNKPESHFAVEIWSATKYRRLSLNRNKWIERNWNCLSQWRLRDLQGSGPLPSLSRLSRSEEDGHIDRLQSVVGQLKGLIILLLHHHRSPRLVWKVKFVFKTFKTLRWWRGAAGREGKIQFDFLFRIKVWGAPELLTSSI